MATKEDIDFAYTFIDELFRLSIGESGDISCAKYDSDFSLSLEEAQTAKYKFICDSLGITKGSYVLDMGCGWGPFIKWATEVIGAKCVGLTLSKGQAAACIKNGFDVHIKDCRTVKPEDFGKFDAVVSIGSFEHFCSVEDYKGGRQEEIYQSLFNNVYDLLHDGGRFYLQTMLFGKNMIRHEDWNIRATKQSDSYILALTEWSYPGSFLPLDLEMILRNAKPYFKLNSQSNGRLDYLETFKQWRKRFRTFDVRKYWIYLTLLFKCLTDRNYKYWLAICRIMPNKVCFERELLDHYRLVFEKTNYE